MLNFCAATVIVRGPKAILWGWDGSGRGEVITQYAFPSYYFTMSLEVGFNEKNMHAFVRKHNSTCSGSTRDIDSGELEGKVASLEHQYVRMEMEYSQRIKELKSNLAERTRKQASLINEITDLRSNYRGHQEEIMRISEELAAEELKSTEAKSSKKNTSPGLIRKSLDNEKKLSPSSNQASKQLGKIFGQVKKQAYGGNSSPGIKRQSPRGNPNGILHLLKQDIQLNIRQEKQTNVNEHHSGKKLPLKNSGDNKKKGFSPKNLQQPKLTLLASMKNAKKEGNSPTNGSPRRPIRRSPGEKPAVPKVQPRKEGKQLLGKLKENADIEEVF